VALTADAEVTPIPSESFRNFLRSIGSWMTDASFPGKGWVIILAVGVLLAVLNLGKLNMSVIVAGLSLAFLAILSFGAKNDSKEMVFGSLLAFVAALLLVGCEVLYVKDHFSDGDLYRMNSVFKFHYQVWLLLSIAIAPLLKWLLEVQYPAWQVWQRVTWIVLALFVLIGAAMYPALTVYERARNVSNRTLDGLAGYRMSNPGDTEAAEWVKKNVVPVKGKTPVVLESWGGSYSTFARIATQSGVPTILGWDFHEAQWRGSWLRPRSVAAKWMTPSSSGVATSTPSTRRPMWPSRRTFSGSTAWSTWWSACWERDGTPHKPGYPAEGLAKFGMMGPLVFNQSGTVITRSIPTVKTIKHFFQERQDMLEGWNVTKKDKIAIGILAAVCLVGFYLTLGGRQPKPKLFVGGGQGSILMQGGSYGRAMGQFDYPRGIAVDAAGNFYVADSRNHRIQKFRSGGQPDGLVGGRVRSRRRRPFERRHGG
jgi:DNA-binding beta-propeller fold protein YncE